MKQFRHVHLDFHTAGAIPSVGTEFDREAFGDTMAAAHVDSVTLFAKCHHGYSYYPTEIGVRHPSLSFDLLGEQLEACRTRGIDTTVYLSAGLDEYMAQRHPEWLARQADERCYGNPDFTERGGFHTLCFGTGYLDYLVRQTQEVMERYHPRALFFDICGVRPCYCAACRSRLRARGGSVGDFHAVMALAEETYLHYLQVIDETVHAMDAAVEIFHNGGHIPIGKRDLIFGNTHLELESLPTGGWGYDHFPKSAAYAMTLGIPYVGMTGKFHTTWGEFGGYKHPNALRYEASLALTMGAGCSIGDQLHPYGDLDQATYRMIGDIYREVEEKEPWCGGRALADVAVLSVEGLDPGYGTLTSKFYPDLGASRILYEGHYLFHLVDTQTDLSPYAVVILPDQVRLTPVLAEKIRHYMDMGGKVLATGQSGLGADSDQFVLPLGVQYEGTQDISPSYLKTSLPLTHRDAALVLYCPAYQVAPLAGAETVGWKSEPFFQRTADHFCSHQHAPSCRKWDKSGIVLTSNAAYAAWELFSEYAKIGALQAKEVIIQMLDYLLGTRRTLRAALPDRAITTLFDREAERQLVQHILFAHTTVRGSFYVNPDNQGAIEVIESLVPLQNVDVEVRISAPIRAVTLEPQGIELPFVQQEGLLTYTVPRVLCHQIVCIQEATP